MTTYADLFIVGLITLVVISIPVLFYEWLQSRRGCEPQENEEDTTP